MNAVSSLSQRAWARISIGLCALAIVACSSSEQYFYAEDGSLDATHFDASVFDARDAHDGSNADGSLADAGFDSAVVDAGSFSDASDANLGDGGIPWIGDLAIIDQQSRFGLPIGIAASRADAILLHPQFIVGFDYQTKNPDWVAWVLDASWLGTASRTDNFVADPFLPSNVQARESDYQNSGFTRGHMCPSGDRKRTNEDTASTFVWTNVVPQSMASNNAIWNSMEDALRNRVTSGRAFFIVSGPLYDEELPCIGARCIAVPSHTWKVALEVQKIDNAWVVLSGGEHIAVIVPNTETVSGAWTTFQTSIDAVEIRSGLDFFSEIEDVQEEAIEAALPL